MDDRLGVGSGNRPFIFAMKTPRRPYGQTAVKPKPLWPMALSFKQAKKKEKTTPSSFAP